MEIMDFLHIIGEENTPASLFEQGHDRTGGSDDINNDVNGALCLKTLKGYESHPEFDGIRSHENPPSCEKLVFYATDLVCDTSRVRHV
ncbi:hypothetical protein SDC9_200950 [bioreactor metagenome]|uniref:Uncharacterized protein n=1 Tax=bioreactor metagenome TaxID=1076179 RepID=A0A645IQB7_9ZZZZ